MTMVWDLCYCFVSLKSERLMGAMNSTLNSGIYALFILNVQIN